MSLTRIAGGINGQQALDRINDIMNALDAEATLVSAGTNLNFASITSSFARVIVSSPTGAIALSSISNLSQETRFFICPNPTTVLTITDKAVDPTGNIHLNAPTKVIDGSKFGYIELQLRTVGGLAEFYEVGFNDQYNQ